MSAILNLTGSEIWQFRGLRGRRSQKWDKSDNTWQSCHKYI